MSANAPVEESTIQEPMTSRKFRSECYVVAIDAFFLSTGRWTEHPTYARKYSDPGKAAQDAEDLRLTHPSSKIRVCTVKATWTVKEPEV
jgi:hypothetical protein